MFKSIPPERFAQFHREFQGDTWDVCERCGGMCEINKIGSLMPGEAEYIAASLRTPVLEFRNRYLDGIETPHGVVDVLKLKPGCPFLNPDFRCTIKDVKVVLCDAYPVVFEVVKNKVHFSLDEWCPIVRFVPELAEIFEKKAIPAIQNIDAPVAWYRAVEMFDGLCVDYNKLFKKRAGRLDYAILSLHQIRECVANDAPPPALRDSSPLVNIN